MLENLGESAAVGCKCRSFHCEGPGEVLFFPRLSTEPACSWEVRWDGRMAGVNDGNLVGNCYCSPPCGDGLTMFNPFMMNPKRPGKKMGGTRTPLRLLMSKFVKLSRRQTQGISGPVEQNSLGCISTRR